MLELEKPSLIGTKDYSITSIDISPERRASNDDFIALTKDGRETIAVRRSKRQFCQRDVFEKGRSGLKSFAVGTWFVEMHSKDISVFEHTR